MKKFLLVMLALVFISGCSLFQKSADKKVGDFKGVVFLKGGKTVEFDNSGVWTWEHDGKVLRIHSNLIRQTFLWENVVKLEIINTKTQTKGKP